MASIGDWDTSQLYRFVQQLIRDDPIVNSPIKEIDQLTVHNKLSIGDQLTFDFSQTTVGSAGGATALPANPDIYVRVVGPDGIPRLIPLYKTP